MYSRLRRLSVTALTVALAAGLVGLSAVPAHAAAPINDHFSAASALTPGSGYQNVFGTTAEATLQTGEPSHTAGGAAGQHSVWYVYTPTQSGTVTLNVQSSEIDPLVVLYQGNSMGTLVRLAGNDDVSVGSTQALVEGFPVTAGLTYRIAVADHGAPGAFLFEIAWNSGHPRDASSNPRSLDPVGLWETWTNTATTSAGDPQIIPGAAPHANVWASFVPQSNGRLELSTEGSGFDTVMAVYSVVGGVKERIAFNDDAAPGTASSALSVELAAKRYYLIAVGGFTSTDRGRTLVSTVWTPSLHPDNDDFAGALPLGSQELVTADTSTATTEAGEPVHLPGVATGRSVWYAFEGEVGRNFSMDLAGTSFDSVVTLYRGGGLGTLERIAADRGQSAVPARPSRLSLVPLTSAQYYVAVSGVAGAAGALHAKVAILPPPSVTAVSAAGGPLAGGNVLRIDGFYLDGATQVHFGTVPAAEIDGIDGIPRAQAILVTVPSGLPGGPVPITVSTAGGTASTRPTYVVGLPTVTSLSRRYTRLAGGRTVTITGTEFRGVPVVRVGGVRATGVTRLSATKLTFVTPKRSAGPATVTVATAYGTSRSSAGARITYLRAPRVTALSRRVGRPGLEMRVSGGSFVAVSKVTVGGKAARFRFVGGVLMVRIPSGVSGRAVHVRVQTPGGLSAVGARTLFTYR